MRVLLFILALATTLWTFFPAAASADPSTPSVDWRQHNQGQRIYNGIQNGSLTYRETGSLMRGQARVHRMERNFKSDGVVTRRERARLHRSQNRQNRRIHRKKHN